MTGGATDRTRACDEPGGRRFFVPIGVGRPGDNLRELPGVPVDLQRMTDLFQRRGYTIAPRHEDLSAGALRTALGDWLSGVGLGHADTVVLYFTGHGCVVDGDHYLAGRGFSKSMAATTGFKTQDLIELVSRRQPRPGKLWLIVDCCAAGGVLGDGVYRALGASGVDSFVLAASNGWSETFDGSFSAAFRDAVDEAAQASVPYSSSISLDQVTAAVNRRRPGPRAIQAGISASRFDFLDCRPDADPVGVASSPGSTQCR